MPESAFQIQYRQQFIEGFGRRQTVLRELVTRETIVKGNQGVFLIGNDNATVVTRGISGDIAYQPNDTSQTTVTLTEKHSPISMTGFNIFASQGDQRQIMQWRSQNAINRDIDDVIIAAANGATTTSGVTGAATLNWLLAGRALLGRNNSGIGDITALVTVDAEKQLLKLAQFTSADYVEMKPFAQMPDYAGSRGYYNFMGMKIVPHNALPGRTTSSATCFMFHRSALGHAAATSEIQSEMDYDKKQDASWVRTTLYHGALLLQNEGVIKMTHDDTAA